MIIACEKHPIFDHITENIFLGDVVAASNIELLNKNNIEIVISLIYEKYEKDLKIKYYEFPINDNRNEDISIHFEEINKIIGENKNKNILIHCQNAVSRSVAIVLAYLMSQKINLKNALNLIKSKRNTFTRPNIGFAKKLLIYEKNILGENSLLIQDIIN